MMFKNLYELITNDSNFKIFKSLFISLTDEQQNTLANALKETKNITAFIPTEQAFNEFLGSPIGQAIQSALQPALQKDGDPVVKGFFQTVLYHVLAYHVVLGLYCRSDLQNTKKSPQFPKYLCSFELTLDSRIYSQQISVGAWKDDDGDNHVMVDHAEIIGKANSLPVNGGMKPISLGNDQRFFWIDAVLMPPLDRSVYKKHENDKDSKIEKLYRTAYDLTHIMIPDKNECPLDSMVEYKSEKTHKSKRKAM